MKQLTLTLGFLFTCLLGATACSSERDVTCDITWSDSDGNVLDSTSVIYDELDDVDAGLEMCQTDQEDHPDRPADATAHQCQCST